SDRRARHARREDEGQPRRDREQADREPRVRPARRVRRRSEDDEAMKRLALALCVIAAGCRERELPLDAGHAEVGSAAVAATSTRILYPSAPGSFVDLVAGARHGVVAIQAATPVKAGPAAMFPGAPEATADVALGTGFLIESKGVFVLTNDHIAAASTELK